MARVLAASFVSPGQAFPVVSVALELQRRGHDVVYWAATGADGVIKGFGFPTVSAGRWRGGPSAQVPGLAGALEQSPETVVSAMAATYLYRFDDQVAEFLAVLDEVRPDVVLTGSMLLGMVLAAEAAGVPCASVAPTLYHPGGGDGPPPFLGLDPADAAGVEVAWKEWRSGEAPAVSVLAAKRAELGLAPRDGGLVDHMGSQELQLVPSTPRLELPGRTGVPPWVRYVGPCALDAAAQFQALGPPPDWDVPEGAVLVTGGTVLSGDFVGEAARALRGVAPVVALTWMADPAALHEPPAVLATRYLPMDRVLPRTAAVVSNGGSGGVVAALAAGRPLVIVPGHSDQGDNAVRVQAAGVGLRVARSEGPSAVRAAVGRVLAEEGFAARAGEMGSDLADRGGPPAAADAVEALAAR